MHPIMGGVCPVSSVSGPVGGPPPTPGEPHLIGASPGLTGSLWISGALFRYRDGDGNEWGQTGSAQSTPPGALVRSVRYNAEEVEYIDDSGVARRISKTSLGTKPAGALAGSIRYDASQPAGDRVTFAGSANHYKWSNGF